MGSQAPPVIARFGAPDDADANAADADDAGDTDGAVSDASCASEVVYNARPVAARLAARCTAASPRGLAVARVERGGNGARVAAAHSGGRGRHGVELREEERRRR